MKRIKLLLIGFALAFSVQAQNTPQGIAYQAVAVKDGSYSVAGENPQSVYWSNKAIKVRFTIFDQYPNGTQSYQEYHETNTDAYGVFNLIIGQGTVISGNFENIPWERGTAHLQVEIDFNNDNTYTLTSLERFWSVPYAFFSEQSLTDQTDSAIAEVTDKITYLSNRDRDTVVGNEIQSLTIQGDSLSISGANTVKLNFPANLDNDPGNELQTLSVNGDSLGISNGNTVKLLFPKNLDNDSTNELQRIVLTNDTIRLSHGGGNIALQDINDYIRNYQDTTTFLSSGRFIGFDSDTLWKCPQGVNRIIIELWGGGGKNGNRKYCNGYCNNSTNSEANGGVGGNGGYLRDTITVVPGQSYAITIGDVKTNSTNTYFGNYYAEGGGNGGNAYCPGGCARAGARGTNGSVIGYDYKALVIPAYIPNGYVGNEVPDCCAPPNARGFAIIQF